MSDQPNLRKPHVCVNHESGMPRKRQERRSGARVRQRLCVLATRRRRIILRGLEVEARPQLAEWTCLARRLTARGLPSVVALLGSATKYDPYRFDVVERMTNGPPSAESYPFYGGPLLRVRRPCHRANNTAKWTERLAALYTPMPRDNRRPMRSQHDEATSC